MKRIGVDVGGTFTDAVLFDEETGLVASAKASSTHPKTEVGVIAALEKLNDAFPDRSELRYLVHGTTVATNAVLEQSGPRVALATTEGFRDVLEIARLWRTPEEIYDLLAPQPPCLVARRDRFEVKERLSPTGQVMTPLDEDGVERIAATIRKRGIKTVAVSLLYSYLEASHERQVRDVLRREIPDVHVTLSSEVLAEYREYERTSTTVLNAYLVPVVSRYLTDLEQSLSEWHPETQLWVMQSSGGVASPQRAADLPVALLLSGPSGGVVAGRLVAEQAGLRHSVTMDMGGTSFDACLLPDNEPAMTHDRPFMEIAVRVPSVDVLAIGAGGGSIGWVDQGGQFRVGPRSAGANPGPACYGRGGDQPTVTDANLVLGVLGEDQRLAGEVGLDRDAAWRACERLGKQLGLSAVEAAWGIRRVVNATMAGAVRAVSVGRGYDPREFGLVAFGGAGPMHALDIADELGIPSVVLPPVPGCHSAVGLVVTDITRDYVTTLLGQADDAMERHVTAAIAGLQETAQRDLADEGVDEQHRDLFSSLDMRYAGEQFSVNVPVRHQLSAGWLKLAVEDFHDLHNQLYGFRVDGEPVEVINVRLRATGRLGSATASSASAPPADCDRPVPTVGTRRVAFGGGDQEVYDVPVCARHEIPSGSSFEGPAIIEQDDSTAIVSPGKRVRCDVYGNLIVTGGAS
jgi:N-methylhydantoinase A